MSKTPARQTRDTTACKTLACERVRREVTHSAWAARGRAQHTVSIAASSTRRNGQHEVEHGTTCVAKRHARALTLDTAHRATTNHRPVHRDYRGKGQDSQFQPTHLTALLGVTRNAVYRGGWAMADTRHALGVSRVGRQASRDVEIPFLNAVLRAGSKSRQAVTNAYRDNPRKSETPISPASAQGRSTPQTRARVAVATRPAPDTRTRHPQTRARHSERAEPGDRGDRKSPAGGNV